VEERAGDAGVIPIDRGEVERKSEQRAGERWCGVCDGEAPGEGAGEEFGEDLADRFLGDGLLLKELARGRSDCMPQCLNCWAVKDCALGGSSSLSLYVSGLKTARASRAAAPAKDRGTSGLPKQSSGERLCRRNRPVDLGTEDPPRGEWA
jgi:hypothetical protein